MEKSVDQDLENELLRNGERGNKPFFSIVMPTYNSEETIETALKSICMQTCIDDVEILVIDGGSTDSTVEIAKKYGAKIINNPDKLPEYAKKIGIRKASGLWLIKQDSDEEWTESTQLEKRRDFLRRTPEVKVYEPDIEYPEKGRGISSGYAGTCGDPFSFFVYRYSLSFLETYKKNIIKTNQEHSEYVFFFHRNEIIPICDGGTDMVSLDYLHQAFDDEVLNSIGFATSMSYEIIRRDGHVGSIKDDTILHHNNGSFRVYLSKLRFRVNNNLSKKDEGGYSLREETSPRIRRRKYLFFLYALTIIGPIVDGALLSLKHKDISFMLHFFYVYYVILYGCGCFIRKARGMLGESELYGK